VTIDAPGRPPRQLWYRVLFPEGWRLTESLDPFVPVPLFEAMRSRLPLHVEGDVSPSLLANLEEFQRFWARWYPERFVPVDVTAEREHEQPAGEPGAVMAFSAGLDSCFTAYRHAMGEAGRQGQTLRAGVMAHGFDIPIEDDGYGAAADSAEAMLASVGVPLVRVATNVRHVEHAWDDAVGAAVASVLHLLQPNAQVGLVPGSMPPDLQVLWGSNPISDPLLSSDPFRIVEDGPSITRPEKVKAIAEWPAAMEGLRVCWASPHRDRNCGRCGKCVRTIMCFRAVGVPIPSSFEREPTDAEIRRQPPLDRLSQPFHRMPLDAATQAGIDDGWVRAARKVWRRTKRHELLNAVRAHFRRLAPTR
jgi:hypothetical protein